MKIIRTVTEFAEDGIHYYEYTEVGFPGGDSPHCYLKPREREYWYAHQRCRSQGDIRMIDGREWEVCNVKSRWFGLLAPRVTWRPKLIYR